ncbi:MAG: AAA family ATPase [Deltaproteobacteria bacterium]|nr:MAG: AAA family ATPase [Deltaproteobacteria bacterium]
MYLKHFRLEKHPFHVTPDPEFLYMSPSHREALASIIYGVEERKGFIAIIGDVGVGKTTILRSYLEKVDRNQLKTIYVFSTNISSKDLMRAISVDLGVPLESDDFYGMVHELHVALIEEYLQGRNVVLIIDEAQNMPAETLENLRMLSNLETSKEKLLQIVLCGQLEFDESLNRRELRALHQRISIKTYIVPLSQTESREYVRHRLSLAGRKDMDLFTNSALNRIVATSRGIPRTINILCDNCLVSAFGARQNQVTGRIAREMVETRSRKTRAVSRRWSVAVACLLLAIPAGIVIYHSADWIPSLYPWMAEYRLDGQRHGNPGQSRQGIPDDIPVPRLNKVHAGNGPLERKEASVENPAGEHPSSVVRIVRKGDTVSALSKEVYGFFHVGMIGWIKKANPWIVDPDRIDVGENIYFPDLHANTGWKSENHRENQ